MLKHIDAPGDDKKIHFDLLLEDQIDCRTWRLEEIPPLNGKVIKAITSNNHRLAWLQKTSESLSGGRGFATRIDGGIYQGDLPANDDDLINIYLCGENISGQLKLQNGSCQIFSQKTTND